MATTGIRKANWNLISSATTAPTEAASVQPRASRKRVATNASVPTESTWPQTAESKIVPGLNRYRTTAARPMRSPPQPPSHRLP